MVDGIEGIVDEGLQALGLGLDEAGPDRVVMSWTVGPEHLQPYGIVHGGVYCSVVESSASIAAALWFGERGRVVGVANHTNFLRSAREGTSPPPRRRSTAAAASSCGSSRSPTPSSGPSPAARSGCRTSPPEPRAIRPGNPNPHPAPDHRDRASVRTAQ